MASGAAGAGGTSAARAQAGRAKAAKRQNRNVNDNLRGIFVEVVILAWGAIGAGTRAGYRKHFEKTKPILGSLCWFEAADF
jgi:hypothetical protein